MIKYVGEINRKGRIQH